MKKLISLVLALAMILMVGSVFADGDGENTTPSTASLPTAEISITNMEIGDVVSLYKVIKWDSTAADWAYNGINVAEPYETVEKLVAALKTANASAAMTALAAAVTNTQKVGDDVTLTGKTYSSTQEVGSYLALVKGANGNIYNPMILSVNFNYANGGGTAGTVNATDLTGDSIVAKKQPVTVDKEVEGTDNKNDIAVGDTVPFLVHTQTPNYGANYTEPIFTITDTLSTGITMTEAQQTAIKVVVDDTDPEQELVKGTDYTITTSASGYTISFSKNYLTTAKAKTAITVKYTATINEKSVMHNVEQYDNDVDIVYSNSPSTNEGSGHDETHHYTFSIDANLLGAGSGEEVTKELVKIGYDEETDQIITSWETKTGKTWTETVHPLEGAQFTLTAKFAPYRSYSATSDENGYLNFTGLDAGTYGLVETSAPAGYKFSTAEVPVEISARYNDDMTLDYYTVTVNNTNSSTYSATLDGDHVVTETTLNDEADTTGFINKKAVTLPSTGGIGTTIFYILGGVLVIGAAVILIARRKAQD